MSAKRLTPWMLALAAAVLAGMISAISVDAPRAQDEGQEETDGQTSGGPGGGPGGQEE